MHLLPARILAKAISMTHSDMFQLDISILNFHEPLIFRFSDFGFRIWKQSQNEEDRKKYCEAKKDAKRIVYMAMDQKAQEAVEKVDLC